MRVQGLLGADIAMVLDECPPGGAAARRHRAAPCAAPAPGRAARWRMPRRQGQARFGIVQGAAHLDLRLAHLDDIASLPVDGVALGGFSVGEPVAEMYRVLAELAPAACRATSRAT